jgi:hypothetical protein
MKVKRVESGEWKAESREQRAEIRKQRAESRDQKAEIREQWAGSSEQGAESKEQRAESGEQRAESREQMFTAGVASQVALLRKAPITLGALEGTLRTQKGQQNRNTYTAQQEYITTEIQKR